MLRATNQHFLGAARRGNQSYADLRQAHVSLCRGNDVIRTHGDFAAAAQRVTMTGGDHRLFKLAQRRRGLLENVNALIDLVPLLILDLRGHEQQIRAR
jgi:hypothetical protein